MSDVATCHTARVTSLGRRVREARDRRGLTQADVAAAAGCSEQYERDIERGRFDDRSPQGKPLPPVVREVLDFLRVDPWALTPPAEYTYDPDNPPVEQATLLQLAEEMRRRVAKMAAADPVAVAAPESTIPPAGPHAVPDLPPAVQEMRGERFDLPSPLDDLPVTQDNDPSTERGGRSDPGTA